MQEVKMVGQFHKGIKKVEDLKNGEIGMYIEERSGLNGNFVSSKTSKNWGEYTEVHIVVSAEENKDNDFIVFSEIKNSCHVTIKTDLELIKKMIQEPKKFLLYRTEIDSNGNSHCLIVTPSSSGEDDYDNLGSIVIAGV